MTTSEAMTASSVSFLGCSPAMSMPTSAMASTATGLIAFPGIEPAERTSIRPSPSDCRKPAAIWERPALWTQTNSTLGRSGMGLSLMGVRRDRLRGIEGEDQADADRAADDLGDDERRDRARSD